MINLEEEIRRAYKQKAPNSFWLFCCFIAPDFYTDSRPHLKRLCDKLQAFYEGKTGFKKLAISMPPRMGKTRTLILFCVWVFGLNTNEKVMSINYNETLSTMFSKQVRDAIQTKGSPELRTVSDIFPKLKIKDGSGAAQLWALEGKHMSYLGGSPTGTITGIGASISIIDDLVKNAYEALNDTILQSHWDFYNNTLKQRMEEGCKEIVCFTRWATKDLIGLLLQSDPDKWDVIEMKAIQPDGSLLCADLLSHESIDDKKKNMMSEIFEANYQQMPMDIKGLMYQNIKTYDVFPPGITENYTDTADEGNDYLCSINYVKSNGAAYIIDVLYTQQPMPITEPLTAEMMIKDRVIKSNIESNNGGSGFARSVQRIMSDKCYHLCNVNWFHQSQNKQARIFSNSSNVQNFIYMPFDWKIRWPEFADSILTYKKSGKNKHDDAEDAITGVYEKFSEPERFTNRTKFK